MWIRPVICEVTSLWETLEEDDFFALQCSSIVSVRRQVNTSTTGFWRTVLGTVQSIMDVRQEPFRILLKNNQLPLNSGTTVHKIAVFETLQEAKRSLIFFKQYLIPRIYRFIKDEDINIDEQALDHVNLIKKENSSILDEINHNPRDNPRDNPHQFEDDLFSATEKMNNFYVEESSNDDLINKSKYSHQPDQTDRDSIYLNLDQKTNSSLNSSDLESIQINFVSKSDTEIEVAIPDYETISKPGQRAIFNTKLIDFIDNMVLSGKVIDETVDDEDFRRKSRAFRSIFGLEETERLVGCYNCSLARSYVINRGWLYISERYIGYHSRIFGSETRLLIELKKVVEIKKVRSRIGIFPDSISLQLIDGQFIKFSSIFNCDAVYEIIESLLNRLSSRVLQGQLSLSRTLTDSDNFYPRNTSSPLSELTIVNPESIFSKDADDYIHFQKKPTPNRTLKDKLRLEERQKSIFNFFNLGSLFKYNTEDNEILEASWCLFWIINLPKSANVPLRGRIYLTRKFILFASNCSSEQSLLFRSFFNSLEFEFEDQLDGLTKLTLPLCTLFTSTDSSRRIQLVEPHDLFIARTIHGCLLCFSLGEYTPKFVKSLKENIGNYEKISSKLPFFLEPFPSERILFDVVSETSVSNGLGAIHGYPESPPLELSDSQIPITIFSSLEINEGEENRILNTIPLKNLTSFNEADDSTRVSLDQPTPSKGIKAFQIHIWKQYFKDYGRNLTMIRMPCLVPLVQKGIPDELRGELWETLSGSLFARLYDDCLYFRLLEVNKSHKSMAINEIEKDLTRSLPEYPAFQQKSVYHTTNVTISSISTDDIQIDSNSMTRDSEENQFDEFAPKIGNTDILLEECYADKKTETESNSSVVISNEPDGIKSLRRVLTAYSWYDPDLGYCQAMNIVAASLLIWTGEKEVFWLLKHLCETVLPGYYSPSMWGVVLDQKVFETLMEKLLPNIWECLVKREVHLSVATIPWFLTLFVAATPLPFAARVFDRLFSDGVCAIFRIGMAIISLKHHEIIENVFDESDLTDVLTLNTHVEKKLNVNDGSNARSNLTTETVTEPESARNQSKDSKNNQSNQKPLNFEEILHIADTVYEETINQQEIEKLRREHKLKVVCAIEEYTGKTSIREALDLNFGLDSKQLSTIYTNYCRVLYYSQDPEPHLMSLSKGIDFMGFLQLLTRLTTWDIYDPRAVQPGINDESSLLNSELNGSFKNTRKKTKELSPRAIVRFSRFLFGIYARTTPGERINFHECALLFGKLWAASLRERIDLIFCAFCDTSSQLTYDRIICVTEALLQLRPPLAESNISKNTSYENDLESEPNSNQFCTEVDLSYLLKISSGLDHVDLPTFVSLAMLCDSLTFFLGPDGFQSTLLLNEIAESECSADKTKYLKSNQPPTLHNLIGHILGRVPSNSNDDINGQTDSSLEAAAKVAASLST